MRSRSQRLSSRLRRAVAAAATLAAAAIVVPAAAHPHVFVIATATVNFEGGAIVSLTHRWTFDEFYTAQAIDGIAKNKDGTYGRAELAELAKVNIEGLKEFDYFTFPEADKAPVKVVGPKDGDYWLEFKDNVLTLVFTTPLEKPVPTTTKDFTVAITDPSYFIAFDYDPKNPPALSPGAPGACKIALTDPVLSEAEQKLAGAFSQQVSQAPPGMGDLGKVIRVSC